MEIRRVRAGDVDAYRAVRLAALTDAPSAFGSTFEDESAMPLAAWEERVSASSAGPDRATFFAVDGGEIIGLVGGYRADPSGDAVDLVSMWTAPAARRRGVGRALVDAVLEWAKTTGASSVSLWVTRGNDAAQSLYEAMGFAVTGEYQPLPSDPCKDEVRMLRRP